jgi:hypothetical protein
MSSIAELKAAGFSQEEIGVHIQKQRLNLSEAGFSPKEIDEHVGIPVIDDSSLRDSVKSIINVPDFRTSTRGITTSLKAGPPGDEKLEQGEDPSLWDKFLRSFEPSFEKRVVKSQVSLTLAKETGLPPHVFEPTLKEAVVGGFGSSVTGLLATQKVPDVVDPDFLTGGARVLAQASTLAGDFPWMVAGGLIGGGGGPSSAVAGAFALPAGLRKVLMDKYEKGDIQSFSDFWTRLTGAAWETMKGEITGFATGKAGILFPGMGKLPAEVTAMVAMGSLLEGKIPEPQEFIDASIVIGGLKASTAISSKLRTTYGLRGRTPLEVTEDIQEQPAIREDLMSDNRVVPELYKEPVKAKTDAKVESDLETETISNMVTVPEGWRIRETSLGDISSRDKSLSGIKATADHNAKEILIPSGVSKSEKLKFATHEAKHAEIASNEDLILVGEEILNGVRDAIEQKTPKKDIADTHGVLPETVDHMKRYFREAEFNEADLIEEAYAADAGFQDFNNISSSLRQSPIDTTRTVDGDGEIQTTTGKSTLEFAAEEGFKRRPVEPGEGPETVPVKRSDIVKFLNEKLDVPIRTGRFRAAKAVRGIFKIKPEVIRTRLANDIETIAHEVGHGLQKFIWKDLTDKPLEKFRGELEPIATKAKHGTDVLPEGFAEFIRLYMTDVEQAKTKAPKFFKFFEKTLDKESPESKEILTEARDMFEKWIKQPSLMRVLSQISIGEKARRAVTLDDIYTATINDLHPLGKMVKAMAQGEELPAGKDPYKLARNLKGWQGKVEHFFEKSPFKFKTKENIGKPLKAILEPIKDDLDNFRAYAVAKRSLELNKRGIETGILKEDAQKVVNDFDFVEPGTRSDKFSDVFKNLKEYQDATLQYLADSGLLSAEAVKKMREANKDYVPFFRVMEEGGAVKAGKGLEARQPVKGIKGSARDIHDPLESIIKNTYLYINLAEKNAVGRALVDLANSKEGMGKFVERIPTPLQKIKVSNEELANTLKKFGKETITRKIEEKERVLKEEVTEIIEGGEVTTSKASKAVEATAREALTARGFSEAEASQILTRIKGAESAEQRTTIIERTVEKRIAIETIKEFGLELPEEAMEIFRPSAFVPKDNVISVWRNGKRELYQVDPEIARTMQALDAESMNAVVKLLSIPARTLRAGAILSPEFIARNPIRDQFSAFIFSKYGFIPGVDTFKGVFALAGKNDIYREWQKSGGPNSMMVSLDRKYLQKDIKNLMKTPVHNPIKNPIEFLRAMSAFSEAGTRIGEFSKARKKGASLEEAAFASREVTLDFMRVGAKTKAVNNLIAFFNAQLQGGDKMIRAFKDQPVATTLKVAASITLPSILLTLHNRQDPRWEEVPQWQKDLFWIVMTEDHIYRVPKPFEIGIIFGTGAERAVEFILDKDPDAFDGFLKTVGRGILPGIVPTVATPVIEEFANRSLFLDRPIIPAAREELLPEYQYKPYTTEAAKAIGRLLGTLPILKDSKRTSPAVIENYIQGWSGGLGMHVLRIADLALRKAGALPDPVKPTPTLADMPVIKAFVVRHPSAGAESIQKFYDSYFEAQTSIKTAKKIVEEASFKAGVIVIPEEALELIEDFEVSLDNVYKAIRANNKTIDFIFLNQNFEPDEKRQLIDASYNQLIKMAQKANRDLKQFEQLKKAIKNKDVEKIRELIGAQEATE